ncbi:MAG: hypothetical protein U0R79_07595 [Propionicimonas sp.]
MEAVPVAWAYFFAFEQALGTTAHHGAEGASPVGSHKTNSAVAQAYFNKCLPGAPRITTETGAGQWGPALAFARQIFGMSLRHLQQVRSSYYGQAHRHVPMETRRQRGCQPVRADRGWTARPASSSRHDRLLGMAISRAVEAAAKDENASYCSAPC